MLRFAVFGADLALIAALGVFAWLHARPELESAAAGAQPRMSAAAKRMQARDVNRALERLATDPDSLVAAESRSKLGDRARRAVPAGSRVDPDEQSWRPDEEGGGVMAIEIKPPRGPAVKYAAVMVEDASGWKVLATVPLSAPPPNADRP